MRRSTLRQLQIFDAVVRNMNFTRAAEELFLTQSSVSTQIKQLSELIGHSLVEQIGKTIVITEVGERVARLYRDLDREWRTFETDMEVLTSPTKGVINVSAVNTCQYFVPRILGPFYNLYPDIFISLKVFNRQQVMERVAQNVDDFYIIGYIPEEFDLRAVSFAENPLVVVAHPEHALAGKKELPLDALANERFITREPGSGTRREINKCFEEKNVPINYQLELGSNEAIKQGIIGGLGISILSLYAVTLEIRLGILVTLDVVGFPRVREWNIAYPANKVITPVTRTFIDFLKGEGREIARSMLGSAHVIYTDAMADNHLK